MKRSGVQALGVGAPPGPAQAGASWPARLARATRGADPRTGDRRRPPIEGGRGVLGRQAVAWALALGVGGSPAVWAAPGPGAGASSARDTPVIALRGDPQRGRQIVTDRRVGLCLLCHSGPFPEEPFQGTLAPSLAGVGSRFDEPGLRVQLADPQRGNPASLMPSYTRTEGLHNVGSAWRGKPLFDAQQFEDVVAFLLTLKE